jgi:O-antigen/teichoic acid export membrane protein
VASLSVSRLKSNILANFFGKGWAGVLALVFTPVYISSLGIESYGFVGIYVAAQAILAAFDFGLSTALNREIARFHLAAGKEQQLRNLTRTLEAVYWSGALGIGVIGTAAAQALDRNKLLT